MRSVSFYHKETGDLHPVIIVASDDAAIELNTPPDHAAIDHPLDGSVYDYRRHRVDLTTMQVVSRGAPLEDDPLRELRQAALRGAALREEERDLMRRLTLNSGDAEARSRLAAIDKEIGRLSTFAT